MDGQESLHLAQPNVTVAITLTLFNCFGYQIITNELYYEYSGCYPDGITRPRNDVDSSENLVEIKMYPNPVNDKLTLSCIGDSILEIKCYNVLGQGLIDEDNLPVTSTNGIFDYTISTGKLAPGSYLLNIITSTGVTTKKFVKQ